MYAARRRHSTWNFYFVAEGADADARQVKTDLTWRMRMAADGDFDKGRCYTTATDPELWQTVDHLPLHGVTPASPRSASAS